MLQKIASNYVVKTIVRRLFTVLIVVTLTFFIIRALPGNPIDVFVYRLMDGGMSEEEARQRATVLFRIDLNAPLGVQYVEYMGNLLKGDLGDSYVVAQGEPVMKLVMANMPWTLFSVGTALILSFIIGMFLGMLAAYRRNTWIDHLITNLGAAIDSIPNTLTAIILILLVGVIWKLVPVAQMRGAFSPGMKPGFTLEFIWDVLKHWAWPGSIYVLTAVGGWMLAMRSSTLSALGDDYVTVARARGLPDMRILTAYVGRNASLPLVTSLAISLGFVVGGSVLIEGIFQYRGVGILLGKAIGSRDYPVMQGILLVTTITVIISTALADVLYGWLDPRVRVSGNQED